MTVVANWCYSVIVLTLQNSLFLNVKYIGECLLVLQECFVIVLNNNCFHETYHYDIKSLKSIANGLMLSPYILKDNLGQKSSDKYCFTFIKTIKIL